MLYLGDSPQQTGEHPVPQLKRIIDFDTLPDSALLDVKEIRYLAGRSPASIWRDVKRGRLPHPISIGPNASRWRAADVRAYLKGRPHDA
jgi:predicted DNA-binding transcriptional regulator AlpA